MLDTNNVYFASFLMTNGLFVADTKVVSDPQHGRTVQFSFYSPDAEEEQKLKKAYDCEEAKVNIRRYLDNLVLIRNVMYSKLKRNEETGTTETEKTAGEKHAGKRYRSVKV